MPTAGIRYTDTGGRGPLVVLTHGAGMDHTMWRAQAEALEASGLRVIQWDLRGHGDSVMRPGTRFTAADALDDLSALLDAAGSTSTVLVGHSLGGNLVQEFTRRHPTAVDGLIVLDSTWNQGPLNAAERLALRSAAPLLGLVPARRLPALMARASAVTPAAIEQTRAAFARMPKQTFLDVWRATASLIEPDASYRTPIPLALIRGSEDRTGNIAVAMRRWAEAEGVDAEVIPDAGHVVTLDAPDATSRAILRTLEMWGHTAAADAGASS